jgi:hypothetical protein
LVERDCRSRRGRGRRSRRTRKRPLVEEVALRPLVDEVPRVEEIEEPTAGRKGLPVESRKGRPVEEVEKATAGRGGRSATVTRPGAGAWGFEPAAST